MTRYAHGGKGLDMGLGGDSPSIPAPSKPRPTKVQPADLERARSRRDIRSRQASLATRAPLGEARTKSSVLGIERK